MQFRLSTLRLLRLPWSVTSLAVYAHVNHEHSQDLSKAKPQNVSEALDLFVQVNFEVFFSPAASHHVLQSVQSTPDTASLATLFSTFLAAHADQNARFKRH